MAETLKRANVAVDTLASVGFFVIAPHSQIATGLFADEVNVESIRRKVHARIAQYDGVRWADLDAWLAQYFEPLLGRLRIEALAWESIVDNVIKGDAALGTSVREFYVKALRFNAPALLGSE